MYMKLAVIFAVACAASGITANMADLLLSWYAVNGGMFDEINPLLAHGMGSKPLWTVLATFLLGNMMIWTLVIAVSNQHPRLGPLLALVPAVIFNLVLIRDILIVTS